MGYRDAELYKLLKRKAEEADEGQPSDKQISNKYTTGIENICDYAVERAKLIRDTFPLFTLHDETHICNVMRLMMNLLGEDAERLSRDEAAMLVLAACCHDIGMSYSDEEKERLKTNSDKLKQYLDAHPEEFVKAYKNGTDTPQITDEMLSKFLRSIHHERVAEILRNNNAFTWPNILRGKVGREDVIRVCQSHGNDVASLDNLNPTPSIDTRFCAVLLRLADILDFDTSRAPLAVYDYCGFDKRNDPSSIFSKGEWEKHLDSQGFDFENVRDRSAAYELDYSATSRSLQVEQAIRRYLDWVDDELVNCGKELQRYEGKWHNHVLPGKVSRHITAEGYESGEYRLTLDQNKVIDLFVGRDLYSDPAVFVRELIQNAIDAVRTRPQLDKELPLSWKPQINIRTWMDEEGYHWFRIEDNGTGMTKEIIRDHLLKVGSSYYTSAAFEQEKLRCRADPDYKPISRFGIGILSCFMGDDEVNRVEISTKRFSQHFSYPSALRVSMHGMSGYYYMASESEEHKPGPMKGCTDEEREEYLREPGSVFAVRTNLYQSGKYRGFKEIVDKYVLYPPVPIHYDGPEGSFNYPTEGEFMDAIHAIAPSDDIEKDGLLEFEFPQGVLKRLKEEWPEIEFPETPKVLLKIAALDRYSSSPNLTGAVLAARAEGVPSTAVLRDGDEDVMVDLGWFVGVYPKLYLQLSADPPLQDVSERIIERIRRRRGEFGIGRLRDFEWYNRYFATAIKSVVGCHTAAHNGIICGRSGLLESDFDRSCSVILLKDEYRPDLDVSRDSIREIPLEMMLELETIRRALNKQGFDIDEVYSQPGAASYSFRPAKEYLGILERRPELAEKLTFDTSEGEFSIGALKDKPIGEGELTVRNRVSLDSYLAKYRVPDYYHLFLLAYLQNNYALRAEFGGNNRIFISQKRGGGNDAWQEFPPGFFLASTDESSYLAEYGRRSRYACNADHRLSRFMLAHVRELKKRTPGILAELLRSLSEDEGAELIDRVNSLLKMLQGMPGNPFGVEDSLMLTKDDLADWHYTVGKYDAMGRRAR